MSVGLEASGINLIKRAIELDSSKRYTESLICYQEGLQLLMQVVKGEINLSFCLTLLIVGHLKRFVVCILVI